MKKSYSLGGIGRDLIERAGNDVNAVRESWRRFLLFLRWLGRWLTAFSRTRFFHRYGWAMLPLIVITIFQAGIHYNYPATWLGSEVPDQANNIVQILQTGQLPPPAPAGQSCNGNASCQAYQPPLFYELVAIPARPLMSVVRLSPGDATATSAKLILFVLSLIWFLLIVIAIQWIMPRRMWIAKMVTACVCIAIPQVIMTGTMLSSTFIQSVLAFAAILVLYVILRTPRNLNMLWWVLAAGLLGLGIAFRFTGVYLIIVYVAVAVLIAIGYAIKRRMRSAGRVVLGALIGIPLLIIPTVTTVQHIQLYFSDNVVQRDIQGEQGWNGDTSLFFGSFDTDIFNYPVWGLTPLQPPSQQTPGLSSFWSLQYVSLFADVLDRWAKASEFGLPPDQLKTNLVDGSTMFLGHPLATSRFDSIVLVTRLAIPIALIMIIGLIGTLFRFVIHPRRVMRDGTIVILIAALVTLISFALNSVYYHNRTAFSQPDQALFVYVLLLIAGMNVIMRIWSKRRAIRLPIRMGQAVILTATTVFTAASFAFFWINAG